MKADLDREEPGGSSYTLVVVAKDSPGSDENQRRSTRLTIRVMVLDINDNPPVFQPHPDSVTVQVPHPSPPPSLQPHLDCNYHRIGNTALSPPSSCSSRIWNLLQCRYHTDANPRSSTRQRILSQDRSYHHPPSPHVGSHEDSGFHHSPNPPTTSFQKALFGF